MFDISPCCSKKEIILVFYLFFIFQSQYAFAQWEITELTEKVSIRSAGQHKSGKIWLGSNNGGIWLSNNYGKSWENIGPKHLNRNDFRGIAILSENTIIAMSAGEAEKGNAFLIKSNDGGNSWKQVFKIESKGAFFDCIKFVNKKTGYLYK